MREKKCGSGGLLRIILVFVLGIGCNPLVAQPITPLVYDGRQSAYVGAYDLLFLQRAIYSFQDRYIPDTFGSEKKLVRKGFGVGYRLGKLLLLDFQEDCLAALTQHEAFGHCARFREYGIRGNAVNLTLFFPFAKGGGETVSAPGYTEITPHQHIALAIAGVEANQVMANTVSLRCLQTDSMHYREALLYLVARNNQLHYIWVDRMRAANQKQGGDMATYVKRLNDVYSPGWPQMTLEKLSVQSLVSLIDPMQLYAAYTVLYSYGMMGRKHMSHIPMIRIGNTRSLPYFNFELTPFGSQYVFGNVVRYRDKMFTAGVGVGDGLYNNFYSLRAKAFNLASTKRATLNLHLEAWSQPELKLDPYKPVPPGNRIGGIVKTDIALAPFQHNSIFNAFGQVGFKTKGFAIGEPLGETLILRFGIGLRM